MLCTLSMLCSRCTLAMLCSAPLLSTLSLPCPAGVTPENTTATVLTAVTAATGVVGILLVCTGALSMCLKSYQQYCLVCTGAHAAVRGRDS